MKHLVVIFSVLFALVSVASAQGQKKIGGPVGAVLDKFDDTKPAAGTTLRPKFCDLLRLLPNCEPMSLEEIWEKVIVPDVKNDLTYAKALADNAATAGSKLRSTCYAAILVANAQANGEGMQNPDGTPMTMPDPHVITRLEQAAEIIDNLQPTSPIMAGCAAAANAAQVNARQFVTGIITAVAAKAVIP